MNETDLKDIVDVIKVAIFRNAFDAAETKDIGFLLLKLEKMLFDHNLKKEERLKQDITDVENIDGL